MTNNEAIDLLNNLIGMVDDNNDSDYDTAFKMGIDALRQPEIIRCKECGWYGKIDNHFYRKNTCLNPNVRMKPTPMGFCSEGKRREDNG